MHTKRTLVAVALVVGLATSHRAQAAPDPVDILIQHLTEKGIITEGDAADIRAKIAAIAKEPPTSLAAQSRKPAPAAGVKSPIRVSGYIQERYVGSNEDGFKDSLDARRVRFTVSGDVTPAVDFKAQVELAGSQKGQADATSSARFGKPILLDAMAGVKISAGTRLLIGQFKVPFGSENLASSNKLELINRSQVTETLVPGRDNGSSGRDVGVQVAGRIRGGGGSEIEYALGAFNGGGINSGDENDRKDVAGRLTWRTPVPGLSLGADAYDGRRGDANVTRDRYGIDALYTDDPWFVRAEHIWAKDATLRRRGYYATLGYRFAPLSQAVVRYDHLDPNSGIGDDATSTVTLGLNRFLARDGLQRWQLNYVNRREQGAQLRNDQYLAQFQVGF